MLRERAFYKMAAAYVEKDPDHWLF